jgi:hypothetical protein
VKISRLFSGPETPQPDPAPLRNEENTSPPNQSKDSTRGDQRPSLAPGTWQEVSNSTRGRSSRKRSIIRIAEDEPERPLLDISPAAETPGSCYHDASSIQQSPVIFHLSDAEFGTMMPRQISWNERRSLDTLSSPLAKQTSGYKNGGSDIQNSTFEASEYIENIENEVQQAKEVMHPPTTGKPLQEKLKMLRAVNKYLKDTISKLEEAFDERVQQAVEHKAAVEADMHRKITALEEELASKENIIRSLEYNRGESKHDGGSLDALRAVIDRMDQEKASLEEANRVVEKRNETLTELLAQSPTRSHHGFELPSPMRLDSRRTPRPKSMMTPKIPSPSRTENCRRPRSLQPSPTRYPARSFSPITTLKLEPNHPCNAAGEINPRKVSHSASLDFVIGESCSVRSPARGGPRRSSITSNASTSASAWSLPLPISPSDDKATVKQNKHRRTRRFNSGSTQLKPLLLPTIAAEGNAFQTSNTTNLYSSPTRREFSEQSLDTTTSFPSQQFGTPIQPPALPSNWVSETAWKALGGSSEPHLQKSEDAIARHDSQLAALALSPISHEMSDDVYEDFQERDSQSFVDDTTAEAVTTFLNRAESSAVDEQMLSSLHGEASFEGPDQDRTWRDRSSMLPSKWQSSPTTLTRLHSTTENGVSSDYRPLRQVSADSSQELISEPLFLQSGICGTRGASNPIGRQTLTISVPGDMDDSPIPRKRKRSSDLESCSFVMPTLCVNPAHGASAHDKRLCKKHVYTSKALTDTSRESRSVEPSSRPRSPIETPHKRTASPAPLTSVTIRTIFGTLSRYTCRVRELRRNPIALARRLIANVWYSSWKRLGKLSWWVLGLFLGPGARPEQVSDTHSTGRGWDKHDGEAIAGKICDLESRALQQDGIASLRQPLSVASDPGTVRFDDSVAEYQIARNKPLAKSAAEQVIQNPKKQKKSWARSLYLWGKFSVTIMLAISGAVINGPEQMLRDFGEHIPGNISSAVHEQTVAPQRLVNVQEGYWTALDAKDAAVIETSERQDVNKTAVIGVSLPLDANSASGGSDRSFSGASVDPALEMVGLG